LFGGVLIIIRDPQMFVRFSRGIPALGRPIDEPQLQEIRFDHFHHRVCFFADRGSDRTEADRSAVVFFNNCQQHTPVNIIQTGDVNIHQFQSVP